jgi:hypothetical protein
MKVADRLIRAVKRQRKLCLTVPLMIVQAATGIAVVPAWSRAGAYRFNAART